MSDRGHTDWGAIVFIACVAIIGAVSVGWMVKDYQTKKLMVERGYCETMTAQGYRLWQPCPR